MKFLRPDYEVHVRQFVDQFPAPALRHAPHEPQYRARSAAAKFGCDVFHFVERLLLRQVAHAARVQQDHVGDVFRRRQRVALGHELGGDRFAVPLVHLAPVGFDIDCRHLQKCREITRAQAGWKAPNPRRQLEILGFPSCPIRGFA